MAARQRPRPGPLIGMASMAMTHCEMITGCPPLSLACTRTRFNDNDVAENLVMSLMVQANMDTCSYT